VLVRCSAWLAPAHLRDPFREEWLAELDAAAAGGAPLLWLAVGAPVDAVLAHITTRRSAEPTWRPSVADVRNAIRQVTTTPLLSATAVAALAVGIAVACGAFTIVRGLFYGALPVPDPEAVVAIRDIDRVGQWGLTSDYEEYRRRRAVLRSFVDIGAYHERTAAVGAVGAPISSARAAYVSSNTFDLLGIRLAVGRIFDEGERLRGDPVVLVSARLQTLRYGDQSALNRELVVDGQARRVIGVVPAPTRFPHDADLWLPLSDVGTGASPHTSLQLFGRLAKGVTFEQAAAEVATVAAQVERREAPNGMRHLVYPFARFATSTNQEVVAAVLVTLVTLLVLVSAGNVSNLLLARSAARQRELAVRTAMGATRSRLIMQLSLEALVLTALATLLGLAAAHALVAAAMERVGKLPYWVTFEVGADTVMFAVLLAGAIAVVTGLAPGVKATRDVNRTLKETVAFRFGRLSATLIIVETAVAVGLLGAASMMGRAMLRFDDRPYPLPERRVLIAQLYFGQPSELQGPQAPTDPGQRRAIWDAFLQRVTEGRSALSARLQQAPGMQIVSMASAFPGNEPIDERIAVDDGRSPREAVSRIVHIDDRYLDLLEVRLVIGRGFTLDDVAHRRPVAIVNQTFARRFFGEANPLAHRVRAAGSDEWAEIVGVVPDLGINPGDASLSDAVYLPLQSDTVVRVGLRVDGDAIAAAVPLVRTAAAIVPRPQVQWTRSLADQLDTPALVMRVIGTGASSLGLTALLLACMSTYAIVAFSVFQRRREIAIRLALGARGRHVVLAVLGRHLRQLGYGALIGCALSLGIHELMTLMPFAVESGGLVMMLAMLVMVMAAGATACARPLLRALTLRPSAALRE
jgi:putative ABC transport system permease protein